MLRAAIHQVMAIITIVIAHFETSRAASSLFFSQQYSTQPMIPAHKTTSSRVSSLGESQFIECASFPCRQLGDPASSLVRPFGDSVRVSGVAQGGVITDLAATVELVQAAIHEHHAVSCAGLDAVLQLVQVVFPDQVANGAAGNEKLVGEHPLRTVH